MTGDLPAVLAARGFRQSSMSRPVWRAGAPTCFVSSDERGVFLVAGPAFYEQLPAGTPATVVAAVAALAAGTLPLCDDDWDVVVQYPSPVVRRAATARLDCPERLRVAAALAL